MGTSSVKAAAFIRPLLDFDQEAFAGELRVLFAENLATCRLAVPGSSEDNAVSGR